MKHTPVNRPVGLFLFLFVFVVSLLMFPSSPTRAISNPPIIALYYTWYEMGNWNYETMPDRPVPLYQGSDGTTMENHIELASSIGIDAFLCPWRGPDESIRAARCARLHERIIDSSHDMKIAYMIDMSAEESKDMLSEDGLREALHDLREEVIYRQDSDYLPLIGRPALFWLNPHLFGSVEEWQRFRNQVDLYRGETWIITTDMPNFEDSIFAYLDVFDGVFLLDVTRAQSPASALATYSARLQAYNRSHGASKPFIATVAPGYDNTRTTPNGHYRDRANGAYYQQSWNAAAQHTPDAVFLNSFNGFHTGTHIETSENFANHYIDLTRSLIASFRGRVPSSVHGSPTYIGQTGHFLTGSFRAFWYQHGGVGRFGYPITDEFVRQSDGKVVQYFERARFELRRTGPNQAEVDLGLLGADYADHHDMPFAEGVPLGVGAIDGAFRPFWNAYSGQAAFGYPRFFGYPISGALMQQLSDGQEHLVQYFERVRLELHGNTVVVGLLGHELAPCHHKQPRAANNPPPAPLQEGDDDPCPVESTAHAAVTNAAPGAAPVPVSEIDEPEEEDRDEDKPDEVFGVARGRVYYQVVAPGTVQGFQAWNYAPNEVVSLWYNLPDGSTRELPYKATADENGYVLIGFQTERSDPEGQWSLVGKGVESKRVVVAPFELRW